MLGNACKFDEFPVYPLVQVPNKQTHTHTQAFTSIDHYSPLLHYFLTAITTLQLQVLPFASSATSVSILEKIISF